MSNFFFLTTYDDTTGRFLEKVLNRIPEVHCTITCNDPFIKRPLTDETQVDLTIDDIIQYSQRPDKKINGDIQRFSCFDLQNKTLLEKTKTPYKKANILISPLYRIQFLLDSWLENNTPTASLQFILNELEVLKNNKSTLFEVYCFDYFYTHIKNTVIAEKIADLNAPHNHLFIIALAKVISFDLADIPVPGKSFVFEKLLNNPTFICEMVNYITNNTILLDDDFIKQFNHDSQIMLNKMSSITASWKTWQIELIHRYLNARLHGIYYPHIDKPLNTLYSECGLQITAHQEQKRYSKLISIQLNSNRPAQLAAYFDNIEETTDHPNEVEVLVNIDVGNNDMKSLLENEIPKRKFTLKYIETPRPKSFCDLWKPINELLKITDPNAYFLLNISDEMFFKTQGWDTVLKKYVGFFPDDLFRLRGSRNKFRNYFDPWECSFAQDAIPITTKKWVQTGGNWNPCFGPDSYQQLIAYYLAKEGQFSNDNYLRELPLIDIQFSGDVPAIGIARENSWKHCSDHVKAMEICQSYKMQLEARRRAMLIKANIITFKDQLADHTIKDEPILKEIHIIDNKTQKVIQRTAYSVNWFKIMLKNQWRKLFFNHYFGDGKKGAINPTRTFLQYLHLRYQFVHFLRQKLARVKNKKKIQAQTMRQLKAENAKLIELIKKATLEKEQLHYQIMCKNSPENRSHHETIE